MQYSPGKPTQNHDFHLEQMGTELLLFNPSSTRIMALNEYASVIWKLCDGSRTTAEIIALLQAAYPEAASSIPEDVVATLKSFLDNDAITVHP